MDLITLILVLIVVGVALYLINRFIPMDDKIKTILNIVVVVVVCLWLFRLFFPGILTIPVEPIRR